VRFGILGTGVVGRTIAARLDGMGHEVMVGTRDPEETTQEEHPRSGSPRSAKRQHTVR
jgi:8-hydroxy-5-deazaflavin:NADPH oxidoreductase